MRSRTAVDYILFFIYTGIFLGLPNIASEYLKGLQISAHYLVSTNALIGIAAYVYLIEGFRGGHGFSELPNRYTFVLLLILFPILLSGINAYNTNLGMLYTRNFFFFYLLSVLVLWRLKSKEDVLLMLRIFFLSGFIFSVLTYLFSDLANISSNLNYYEAGKDITYRLNFWNINANTLGYAFAVMVMVNITLVERKNRWNFLLIAASALQFILLLLTFSRGAFLILLVELSVFVLIMLRSIKTSLYITALGLIIYLVLDKFYYSYIERFMTIKDIFGGVGTGMDESILTRSLLFSESLDIGLQHIFLGIGGYNLNDYVEYGTHNQFLSIFVENGIFTFLIYSMLLLYITWRLLAISNAIKDVRREKKISACLAAIMCGSIVQGTVSYLRYDFWLIFSISIAWIAIINKQILGRNLKPGMRTA